MARALPRCLAATLALAGLLAVGPAAAAPSSHTVVAGDTLWEIARRHGVRVRDIAAANGIAEPDRILVGQVLVIPDDRRSRATRATRAAGGAHETTADALRVRAGPGTEHAILGLLPRATRVQVRARSGSWRRVDHPEGSGWVHADYLRPARAAARRGGRPGPRAAAPPAGSGGPSVARRSRRQDIGNSKVGAAFVRRMLSRQGRERATFRDDADARVRLLRREKAVLGVRREVVVSDLSGSPDASSSYELTLLGKNRFKIGKSFTRSFTVGKFETPVPVGPIVLTVEARVAATLRLEASPELRWDGRAVRARFTGSFAVSGTLSLAVGVPVAKAGVEGTLTLLKASLPADTTFRRRSLDFDVDLVLESRVDVGVFAQVGIGFLKKKLRVGVPFLGFELARREYPIARGRVVVGS